MQNIQVMYLSRQPSSYLSTGTTSTLKCHIVTTLVDIHDLPVKKENFRLGKYKFQFRS